MTERRVDGVVKKKWVMRYNFVEDPVELSPVKGCEVKGGNVEPINDDDGTDYTCGGDWDGVTKDRVTGGGLDDLTAHDFESIFFFF